MSNIVANIHTIGNKWILEVTDNPEIHGAQAPIGSIALFQDKPKDGADVSVGIGADPLGPVSSPGIGSSDNIIPTEYMGQVWIKITNSPTGWKKLAIEEDVAKLLTYIDDRISTEAWSTNLNKLTGPNLKQPNQSIGSNNNFDVIFKRSGQEQIRLGDKGIEIFSNGVTKEGAIQINTEGSGAVELGFYNLNDNVEYHNTHTYYSQSTSGAINFNFTILNNNNPANSNFHIIKINAFIVKTNLNSSNNWLAQHKEIAIHCITQGNNLILLETKDNMIHNTLGNTINITPFTNNINFLELQCSNTDTNNNLTWYFKVEKTRIV